MLISEDDPADMRVIAEKAARLITMHVPKGPDSCTTVAADEDQEGSILWQPLREVGIRRLRTQAPKAEEPGASHLPQQARPGPGHRPQDVHVFLLQQVWQAASLLRRGLCLAGKLGCQGVILAICPSRLFHVMENSSNCRFLVDMGSAFSIKPWQSAQPPSGPSLSGTNDCSIPCWGERPITITIHSVPCLWSFLLATISFPILGAHFLHHHSLLMDVANLGLLSGPSSIGPVTASVPPAQPAVESHSYAKVVQFPPMTPYPSSSGPCLSSISSSQPSLGSSQPPVAPLHLQQAPFPLLLQVTG
jgi:hypothetical protein